MNFDKYDIIISIFCDENLSDIEKDIFYSNIKSFNTNIIINTDPVKSIAKAKNKCLKPLVDNKCDYYIMIDDDVILNDSKAIDFYVDACNKFHFLHLHLTNYFKDKEYPNNPIIDSNSLYTIEKYSYDNGVFLIFDKEIIEKVGGWDTNFDGYGGEHSNFARRSGAICNIPCFSAIPIVFDNNMIIAIDAQSKKLKQYELCENVEDEIRSFLITNNLTSSTVKSKMAFKANETNENNRKYVQNLKTLQYYKEIE